MAYQPLNETTVIDYVRKQPSLEWVFPDGVKISAEEVGDGNLNLIFIIKNEDEPKVFLEL